VFFIYAAVFLMAQANSEPSEKNEAQTASEPDALGEVNEADPGKTPGSDFSSDIYNAKVQRIDHYPTRNKNQKPLDTEGSEAPGRFEADTILKSPYKLKGVPLEVDPD